MAASSYEAVRPCLCTPSIKTRRTATIFVTYGESLASRCMCTGISLGWSFIPTELKGKKSLRRRVYHRDGKREAWFLYDDREPRIPIRRDGQLQLVTWGNGRGQSRHLPRTGWTWQSTVESGYWSHIGAILV